MYAHRWWVSPSLNPPYKFSDEAWPFAAWRDVMRILLATSNPHKLREIEAVLTE